MCSLWHRVVMHIIAFEQIAAALRAKNSSGICSPDPSPPYTPEGVI